MRAVGCALALLVLATSGMQISIAQTCRRCRRIVEPMIWILARSKRASNNFASLDTGVLFGSRISIS